MRKRILAILTILLAATAVVAQQKQLSLDECKSMARENNPYQKNAALDLLAAKAQKNEVLAEYFPSLSASAMAFHAYKPMVDIGLSDILGTSAAAQAITEITEWFAERMSISPRYQTLQYGYSAGVMATQPIFAGGRIVNGNRLAKLGVEAAKLKQDLQSRVTDEQIEEKYWLVVSLQEKEKTLADAHETLNSLEKDLNSARSAGLVSDADMIQLKLKISELNTFDIELSGGIKLAKMDLLNAIGFNYTVDSLAADEDLPYISNILLTSDGDTLLAPQAYYVNETVLADSMEEKQLLDIQVKAKSLEKKMIIGETLPTIGMGASYGYSKMITEGRWNGAVFATMNIPITDWGKASQKIKRYDLEVQKAENERDYLNSQLLLRARQLWVNLETAWGKLQAAEISAEYAKEAYERQLAQYHAGLVTMSDLLQTQTSLRQSEDALCNQRIAYRAALNSYLLPLK